MAEMALSGEEGVGTVAQLPPSRCVKKALISSRQTLKLFSTLSLTLTFYLIFHPFTHSTVTCRVFLATYQSRASKYKN